MLCLIDPSIQDHSGRLSDNLGDVVIYRAIARAFEHFFPGEEIRRISSHEPLEPAHYDTMRAARIVFLGGSNLLSSDVLTYNQWNFTQDPADYDAPRFGNAVLFGIGWWQYQDPATSFTADFYRRILSSGHIHSVRDGYTEMRLREAGIENVANTGCPSMWGLEGFTADRSTRWTEDCVFMLTDYYKNPADDEALLKMALKHFRGTIFFFPQGLGDVEYLKGLPSFAGNSRRIEILNHSLEALEGILSTRPVTYFGTRLHGGITALNHRVPSLILGVDNRASEKARNFNLPVIPRTDRRAIEKWLRGSLQFPPIRVNQQEIARWCAQFEGAAIPRTLMPQRQAAPRFDY
jgi:hypothetical protein